MSLDYSKFYNSEEYIFTDVGPRFVKTGKISPADFYMILIWKANRAKTRVKHRLERKAGGFATAVESISSSLHGSKEAKHRLEIMMKEWGFRLPTATAILTVLYPTEFSVYDIRVCDQLNDFKKLAGRIFSDSLWGDYQRFLHAVDAAVPEVLNLRDKDRYLWGKSFYEDIQKDLVESTKNPE